MSDYTIINADDVESAYEGTDVPGEFRSLSEALGCEQLAVTLIRVPPHSDFEQGTGHRGLAGRRADARRRNPVTFAPGSRSNP
jgi:hypothetical protein